MKPVKKKPVFITHTSTDLFAKRNFDRDIQKETDKAQREKNKVRMITQNEEDYNEQLKKQTEAIKGDIVKKKRKKGKTMLVSDLWNGTYSHLVSETYYKAKGLDLREVELQNVRNDCHMKPK